MKKILLQIGRLICYIGAFVIFLLGFRSQMRREAADAGVSDYSGEGRDKYGDLDTTAPKEASAKHAAKI